MKRKPRKFISVYFDDRPLEDRKKRDLTIAFNSTDPLYEVCEEFGSAEIKAAIGIHSYSELVKKAQKADRTLGNYIKSKLKEKLLK